MTTIRQIVIDAYREGGLVQAGLTPDSEEFDEGLRKLQDIVDSLYGFEAGDQLITLSYGSPVGGNSYAKYEDLSSYIDSTYLPQNTRLMVHADSATELFLPPVPDDGARFSVVDVGDNFATNNVTVNGNGRYIEGGTTATLSTDRENKTWFYRADLGEWVLISDLTENSQNPFPRVYDDYLIMLLAMRMNPRYQATTAQETMMFFRRLERKFKAQYRQKHEVAVEEGLRRINERYTIDDMYTVDGTNSRFNRGHIV